MHENGPAELGGFWDWPGAVQFFLQTYAKMSTSKTRSSGKMAFARAAMKTSWPFTADYSSQHATSQGAFTQDELMTKFMQDVHADICSLLRRARRSRKGRNHLRTCPEEQRGSIRRMRQ